MNERKEFQAAMRRPLYLCLLTLPRGRLYKVCGGDCMFAPGYIVSSKPRWPS